MEPPERPAPPRSPPAPEPDPPAVSPRAERLRRIRERIAAGTYDTPDRLDAALEGLLADLAD